MFGRKKMYKKGLADAMQAYEGFADKQKAALDALRQEVKTGNIRMEDALNSLGEDINGVYSYLTSQEKAALYQLSTPLDLKELGEAEQRLLVAVLYQLADDEGPSITDAQKAYIRSVQKYLGITNPQVNIDLSVVGEIDSLEIQKAFLQVALEFFYLQDQDELTDNQEKFLENFSINRKQAELIEGLVSHLYNTVGMQGIAEKYGYVPLEEVENTKNIDIKDSIQSSKKFSEIEDSIISAVVPRYKYADDIVETESYLFISWGSKSKIIRKDTGLESSINCSENFSIWKSGIYKYDAVPDTLLVHTQQNTIELIYLEEGRRETVLTNISDELSILAVADHYFVYGIPFSRNNGRHKVYLMDIEVQKVKEIPIPFGAVAYYPMAAMSDGVLCLWAGDPSMGGVQNIVLNLIDYRNTMGITKQFSLNMADFRSAFEGTDDVVSWYDPRSLIINKEKVIVLFESRFRGSIFFRWKVIYINILSDPTAPTVECFNSSQLFTTYPGRHLSEFDSDGRLFSSFKSVQADECDGIFYIDLETRDEVALVPSNGVNFGYCVFRIQDYIYFASTSPNRQQYRVNINHPGIIENIP